MRVWTATLISGRMGEEKLRMESAAPHLPATLAPLLAFAVIFPRFGWAWREVRRSQGRGAAKLRCRLVNASWPRATGSAFALSGR